MASTFPCERFFRPRLLSWQAAEAAHATVVLVGDREQLQAIDAAAAFRGIITESGVAELNGVRR